MNNSRSIPRVLVAHLAVLFVLATAGLSYAFVRVAPQAPASAHPTAAHTAAATSKTVILVRHAEKDPQGDARDPSLSAAGQKRAQLLARTLERAHVTNLYASEFKRTQETLAPLAEIAKVKVEVVSARTPEALEAAIAALPAGATAVIAGHSNTLPALGAKWGVAIRGRTGDKVETQLGEDEFDRFFVVTLPVEPGAFAPALVELRYGD